MASRYLYYLALAGHAPGVFRYVFAPSINGAGERRDARPFAGLILTFLLSFIVYLGFKPLPPGATGTTIPSVRFLEEVSSL